MAGRDYHISLIDLLTNGATSQTEFSNRKANNAVFVRFQAIPLG